MSDDPVRLSESSDAPDALVRALGKARAQAPSPARVDAITAAVAKQIGSGPDGGGGGGGEQAPTGGGGAAPAAAAGGTALKAGAAVVAIGVVAAIVVTQVKDPAVAPTAPTPSDAAPSAALVVATPSASADAERTLSVSDLPSAPSAPSASARPATPPSATSSTSAADDERAETALVDSAQTELARDPSGALAKCAAHERRFPNGTLAQEREVIAIDALLRLGRRDEAKARAERFKKTWPASGHLRRIEVLLARP